MSFIGLGQSSSSANMANRGGGRGNGVGRGYNNGSRGGGGRGFNGGGRGRGGRGNFTNNQRQGNNGAVVAIIPPARVQVAMVGLFVRFASRKDTLQIGVGTGLRRIMFLKRSMHPRP
jgi:hypothetical protein